MGQVKDKKDLSFPSLTTPPPPSQSPGKTNCLQWDWPAASPLPQLLETSVPLGPICAALPAAEHTSMLAVTQRLGSPFICPFCTLLVSCTSLCLWHLSQWARSACLLCEEVCSPVKTRAMWEGLLAYSQGILQCQCLAA